MIYVIAIMLVLLLISITVSLILGKMYKKYKSNYEQEREKYEGLQKEYSTLVEAYKIKKKNKEKADEKVNDLHTGDSVANAINILRK